MKCNDNVAHRGNAYLATLPMHENAETPLS